MAFNLNEIIEDFKKKEFIHEQQNKESLEILAHTKTLQEQSALLSDQIAEKEEALQVLMFQIASKTQDLKLKNASVSYVEEAHTQFRKKEDERLHEQCTFYEEQWETTRKQIKALYDEAENHHNLKFIADDDNEINLRNMFVVDSFEFNEHEYKKSQDSVLCDNSVECEEEVPSHQPMQISDDCSIIETKSMQNASSRTDQYTWEMQYEEDSYHEIEDEEDFRPHASHEDYTSFGKEARATKRPDQRVSNHQPRDGVISFAKTNSQKGAVPPERLVLTSKDRSYNQKPMTSWVTSSFGADLEKGASAAAVVRATSRDQAREIPQQSSAAHAYRQPSSFVRQEPMLEDDFDDFEFEDFNDEECWAVASAQTDTSRFSPQAAPNHNIGRSSKTATNGFKPKKSLVN